MQGKFAKNYNCHSKIVGNVCSKAEAGHILYLRILYPIHIQAQKRILYHITHSKKRIFASIVTVSDQQQD
jgi:hypothetical protein